MGIAEDLWIKLDPARQKERVSEASEGSEVGGWILSGAEPAKPSWVLQVAERFRLLNLSGFNPCVRESLREAATVVVMYEVRLRLSCEI
jgi:hypothetical protein